MTVEAKGFEVGSWGWQCEDCTFFTYDDRGAESHSDNFRHSLARCPSERRRDEIKPDLTPVIDATKAFVAEHGLRSVTVVTDTHVIQVTEPSVWSGNTELELEVREIDT
jgi:hypothetical protein